MDSYVLNATRTKNVSSKAKSSRGIYSMSKKHYCIIEVKIPLGPEGWKIVVNDKMRQTLEKLKVAVEELGGRVFVRY